MFPIIPQFFNNTAPAAPIINSSINSINTMGVKSNEHKHFSKKFKQNYKNEILIISDCDIDVGAKSLEFTLNDTFERKNLNEVLISLNEKKELIILNKNTTNLEILHNIKISNDCHSYNLLLHKISNYFPAKFLFQTVKPIKSGDELLLWFSDDILVTVQMNFLTLGNIQGQKHYVCHKCNADFEYPNPLKLHLTLNCNAPSNKNVIKLLNKYFNQNQSPLKEEKFTINALNLSKENSKEFRKNPENDIKNNLYLENGISKIKSEIIKKEIDTSYKEIKEEKLFLPQNKIPSIPRTSAFQPYLPKILPNHHLRLPIINFPTPNQIFFQNNPNFNLTLSHEAQIETVVSNLGKSKQGHLCIYCGKIYSRKYGLKIHIRTHTGFKPLKCKYCFRPFGDPSNLNKHVRLHAEGETPYKCELCHKILVRRRDLERHMKSRHMSEINVSIS